MKKLQIAILTAAACTLISSHALAQNHSVQGLAIGGSTGAIAGQAIGRNAESTIIGATIGGVLGAVIGSGMHSSHHVVTGPPVVHHRVVTPRPVVYKHVNPAPRHYRPNHGPKYTERCRETVRTKSGHYKSKTVVSTVCWNEKRNRPDAWNYHHRNRHEGRWNPAPHHRF